MPFDPPNLPFSRSAPSAGVAESNAGIMLPPLVDTIVRAEGILLEEYNFASVTAYQAKEESTALFNLYLLASGALATGLGVLTNAVNRDNRLALTLVATLVLALAGTLSYAMFVKLLALRREYSEAQVAMGIIKEFYIAHLRHQMPDIDRAFRWRLRRLPSAVPIGGSLVLLTVVALLGSLCVAGAVAEARQLYSIASDTPVYYTPDVSLGALALPFGWEVLGGIVSLLVHAVAMRVAALRLDETINRPMQP